MMTVNTCEIFTSKLSSTKRSVRKQPHSLCQIDMPTLRLKSKTSVPKCFGAFLDTGSQRKVIGLPPAMEY